VNGDRIRERLGIAPAYSGYQEGILASLAGG